VPELEDAELMVYRVATRGKAFVIHFACGELLDPQFYVLWDLRFTWLMIKSLVEGIADIVCQLLFLYR